MERITRVFNLLPIKGIRGDVVSRNGRALSVEQRNLQDEAIKNLHRQRRALEQAGLSRNDVEFQLRSVGSLMTKDEPIFVYGISCLRRDYDKDEHHHPVSTVELSIGPNFDDQQVIHEIITQVIGEEVNADSYEDLLRLLDWRKLNFALRFEKGAVASAAFQEFVQGHIQPASGYKSKLIIMIGGDITLPDFTEVVALNSKIMRHAGGRVGEPITRAQ